MTLSEGKVKLVTDKNEIVYHLVSGVLKEKTIYNHWKQVAEFSPSIIPKKEIFHLCDNKPVLIM